MKYWVVLLLLTAAFVAVGVPLMDNDAAIALHMTETGDYVTLQDVVSGTPYFDKPHLQFWLVGGSFAAHWRLVRQLPDYRVTRLTGRFLNPATRAAEVDQVYFMEQVGR